MLLPRASVAGFRRDFQVVPLIGAGATASLSVRFGRPTAGRGEGFHNPVELLPEIVSSEKILATPELDFSSEF